MFSLLLLTRKLYALLFLYCFPLFWLLLPLPARIAFTCVLSCRGIEQYLHSRRKKKCPTRNSTKSKLWALNNKQVRVVSVERKKKRNENKKIRRNNQSRNSFLAEIEAQTEVPAIHRNRNTKLLRNYIFILIWDFLGDAPTLIWYLTMFCAQLPLSSSISSSMGGYWTKVYLTPIAATLQWILWSDFQCLSISMVELNCDEFARKCVYWPKISIHLLLWPFVSLAYDEYVWELLLRPPKKYEWNAAGDTYSTPHEYQLDFVAGNSNIYSPFGSNHCAREFAQALRSASIWKLLFEWM